MANEETVFVSLDWTHGVNVDGRTVYFGPGERVPVPAAVAEAKGWKLHDQPAPVRAQTADAVESVAAKAGAFHLVDDLRLAGFVTVESIRDASEDELTAVDGIGKATAAKLKTAAKELLS
jgi:predicted flap endonuclease-1-like 5' DNA nuclease